MAKKTKKEKPEQTITIDDKIYKASDLTEQQVIYVNHVADLDRKISSSKFNLDQLNVGRGAFMNLLTGSLETPEAELS